MTEALPRQEILNRNELTVLAKRRNGPCISVYMPTSWVGADMQQNQIRFKNLMRQAADRLTGFGIRGQDIEEMLAPALGLQKNSPFWRQQNTGFALFSGKDFFRYYRLPLEFPEMVSVKDRFHLKPLLPLFSQSGWYYVLSISKKAIHFYQGLRNCMIEVEPRDMPRKLEDITKYDVTDRQHRSLPGSRTGATGLFHGHGSWQDESKDQVVRYLMEIERSIQAFMKEEQAPILLAGVDYIHGFYRDINSYPNLLQEAIVGNPDALRPEDICKEAWKIVQSYYRRAQNEAVDQYRQSAGTGLASASIEDIVPASYHGRTGVLFVSINKRQWGVFNPESNAVTLHMREEQGSEDLFDFSAINTFLNKGVVYELAPQEMPNGTTMAALFRY